MNRRSFTLIELVAVIVVLAILVGVAAPRFFDQSEAAKESATRAYLDAVRKAIAHWQLRDAIDGSADYPNMAQLITQVMADGMPANPYNDLSNINYVGSRAVALTRPADGTTGWRYHYSNSGDKEFIFWANTNTVGENTW